MPESHFLETADRIGSRLTRDAIWFQDRCNWLGWALEAVGSSWTPVYRVQTSTLYDGTAGIALFLGRLYQFTHDPLQRATAMAALNQAWDALPTFPDALRPSLYSGALGITFAAVELARMLDDDALIRRSLDAVKENATPCNDGWIDILGGSAAAIQVLVLLAREFQDETFLDAAQKHGRLLLSRAVKSDSGWSWDTLPGQTKKHLLGYGHGAAGIGCSLLELWDATGEQAYREAALQAFRYERGFFNAEKHNWPDLRSMSQYGVADGSVFAVAWCHGGPGIGFSRLRALQLLHDPELSRELDEALLLTNTACTNLSFPATGSLCLCHGVGGNAELLMLASEFLERRDLWQTAVSVGERAIADIRTNDLPWPCGVNGAGETPNLMLGLAGIGYFFLRLYDFARVPSVLLVQSKVADDRLQASADTKAGAAAA